MNGQIDWTKMAWVAAYCIFICGPSIVLPAYVLSLYREEFPLPEGLFALLLLVVVLLGGSISSAPLIRKLKEDQAASEDTKK